MAKKETGKQKEKATPKKKTTKKTARNSKVRVITNKNITHIRVSTQNKAILDTIAAKLGEMYAKEMQEMKYKRITQDDALTQVLTTVLEEWNISRDALEANSKYALIKKLADQNIKSKEA